MHTSIVDVWKQFKLPHETCLYTDFVCVVLCVLAHLVHFPCGTLCIPNLLYIPWSLDCLLLHVWSNIFNDVPIDLCRLIFFSLLCRLQHRWSGSVERLFSFFRSFGVSVRILWIDNIFVTFVYYYNLIRVIFMCESLFVECSGERFRKFTAIDSQLIRDARKTNG